MSRTECIVCGSAIEPLYHLKNMPDTAQELPDALHLDTDHPVDFELCQCRGCGLVQFDNEPVSYYRDSTRAGERCEALIKLRQRQYRHLIETYNLPGKKIVEIGAGKGGFLRTLKELTEYRIREYGIEYNPEYVRIANEIEHVNVCQGNPEDEATVIEGAPFDAFTSFAYPARLIKPNSMMQCIYNNTVEGAVGIIMVPSMEHLLTKGGFFDITPDHMAYYDTDSLRFLVQKNGFEVLEQGEVADTYIYAIIRKRKFYELERLWSSSQDIIDEVISLVNNEKNHGRKIAIWCAGHFTFTVLSLTGIGDNIEYIIDNADFKKNRYSPASHVMIKGPEYLADHPVETIMILGPIYVNEIVAEIRCYDTDIRVITVDKCGLHEV